MGDQVIHELGSYPPDIDSGTTTSEDNPFAGPKLHTPGKVSVNLPTDEWLCRKMSKLNITLVQGYPTRTSEAGGLLRDQFVRPPKSQQKWYGFHANAKDSDQSVSSWHTGSSKLNSTYLRIARQAGIATSPPMSRPISQENLRKWERSARESTVQSRSWVQPLSVENTRKHEQSTESSRKGKLQPKFHQQWMNSSSY